MTISRRRFLQGTAAGGATLVVAGSLPGCGNQVAAAPVALAELDEDPESSHYGQIAVPAPRFPDLHPVGGAVTVMLKNILPIARPFDVPADGILLIHRADSERPPEYVAVSSLCTHARCPLGYSPHDQRIECPCHRSQFRAVADAEDPNKCAGSVIHKPARGGLTVWEARYDEQTQNVWIDLRSAIPPCGEDDPFPPLEGGEIRMQLMQYPKLGRAGGWVRGRPAGANDKLAVIRVDETTVVALSAICTHTGCSVDFAPGRSRLECPCHGATFDLSGAVTRPPAPRPLRRYGVSFDGQRLVIRFQASD